MSTSSRDTKSMAVLVKREIEDPMGDLEDTRRVVETAESRARLRRKRSDPKVSQRNDREFAQALHREAEQLYHSGDYESALVLYHRAAKIFPRDSSHGIAARRTAATISSWNNPSRGQKMLPSNVRTEGRLAAAVCPESAAYKASQTLKISPTPDSVSEVLSYFDEHKQFWRTSPSPRVTNEKLARSKSTLRQLNNLTDLSLKNLEAEFKLGKMTAASKTAQELLTLCSGLPDPSYYQIVAYHYLSLIHVSLGRHDRAVTAASHMIRLAKATGNVSLFCQSLVILGKVHLSFGHLEAAARAWKNLSENLTELVPLAWIRHEIGRCYFESEKYSEALEMAINCTETAMEAKSKKWTLYGNLLLGQTLAKLGRFAEALEQLRIAEKITKDEGDTPMMSYVQGLIDQVAEVLRKAIPNGEEYWDTVEMARTTANFLGVDNVEDLTDKSPVFTADEDSLLTTVLAERITKCHDGTAGRDGAVVDIEEEITRGLVTAKSSVHLARHELPSDKIQPGNVTFRIKSPGRPERRNIFSSTSSSSSSEAAQLEFSAARQFCSLEDEESENASPTSSETNLTYVVKEPYGTSDAFESKPKEIKNKLEVDEEAWSREIRTLFSKHESSKVDNASGPADLSVTRYLSSMSIVEELDKKSEIELLEMLKDMLLNEENKSLLGLGCHGDISPRVVKNTEKGSRTARSCENSQDNDRTPRLLYRHSLPSSPRKCNANTLPDVFQLSSKSFENSL